MEIEDAKQLVVKLQNTVREKLRERYNQPSDEPILEAVTFLVLEHTIFISGEQSRLFAKVAPQTKIAAEAARRAYQMLMSVPEDFRKDFDAERFLSAVEIMEELAGRTSDIAKRWPLKRRGRREHRDFRFAVTVLALIYLRRRGRWPTVSNFNNEYRGDFIEFALPHLSHPKTNNFDWPSEESLPRAIADALAELKTKPIFIAKKGSGF